MASALGAPFILDDNDFENGVYELRYYTASNLLVKNGVATFVELLTRQVIFQFTPWHTHALGDAIYAEVATPSAFGDGPYETIYHIVSDNADGTGSGALEAGFVAVTSLLSTEWLSNPGLLEFKFGYELQNNSIPGKHLQLFRDNFGEYPENNGFMLRITLIPEPATLGLLAWGGLGMMAMRRRRTA